MYETYTRQSLPDRNYRELLGSAVCVFNSNNSFVIENILRSDQGEFSWYELIDRESGRLRKPILETITINTDDCIYSLFENILNKRNRIIHGFQITDKDGKQRLATKDKSGVQFVITEEYLLEFIRDNQRLSELLYSYRAKLSDCSI